MNQIKILEEKLREVSSVGDYKTVSELLSQGVDPNSKNEINGWTALHWAAKRGHTAIVDALLSCGADKSTLTVKGETVLDLATRPDTRVLLGGEPDASAAQARLPIAPNYLSNPLPLNSAAADKVHIGNEVPRRNGHADTRMAVQEVATMTQFESYCQITEELVVKVRVANSGDPDFIEVELPRADLTYYSLLRVCCTELGVSPSQVARLRKLPDTLIRKDKDVRRLSHLQELEVVVKGCSLAGGCITTNGYKSIQLFKDQTILY